MAVAFTTALTVAFIALFLAIPWEEMRGRFADLHNYVSNFSQGAYRFQVAPDVLSLWQREALWHWALPQIAFRVGSFEQALWWCTVFSVGATAAYVSISTRTAAYLPLLISPMYVDLVYSQVRSAVAISILYVALLVARRITLRAPAYIFAIPAIFIHNFAVVVAICAAGFTVVRACSNFLGPRTRAALLILLTLVIAYILVAQRDAVLAAIQDRRLWQGQVATSGLLLTILLLSLTSTVFWRPQNILKSLDTYLVALAGTLLLLFYLSGLQGGARLVAFSLPALAVALSRWPSGAKKRGAILLTLTVHAAYFSVWAGVL